MECISILLALKIVLRRTSTLFLGLVLILDYLNVSLVEPEHLVRINKETDKLMRQKRG
jgi:hypothetical protein